MTEGAGQVEVWGTGTPRREFLYSDDLAEACVFLMQLSEEKLDTLLRSDEPPLINIGVGKDISIRELAELIGRIAGLQGHADVQYCAAGWDAAETAGCESHSFAGLACEDQP